MAGPLPDPVAVPRWSWSTRPTTANSALKLRIALDDYFPGQPVTLIFGASADKDIAGMMEELLPRVSRLIVTQAVHPRAAEPEELVGLAHGHGAARRDRGSRSKPPWRRAIDARSAGRSHRQRRQPVRGRRRCWRPGPSAAGRWSCRGAEGRPMSGPAGRLPHLARRLGRAHEPPGRRAVRHRGCRRSTPAA